MATSANPAPTSTGQQTTPGVSPQHHMTSDAASSPLSSLPGELHLDIASHMGEDLVSMALAVAGTTSRQLLPYYIPRMPDTKRRLLTMALTTGLPPARLGCILDVLTFGKESEYAQVLPSTRVRGDCEEHVLPPPALGWDLIVPLVWGPNHPGDAVGVLNAAAALGKVAVLKLLLDRVISCRNATELVHGLLTTYPTPLHYACLYAQPHAVRWLIIWYARHARDAVGAIFSAHSPLSSGAPTPFCLAVLGFLFPGRTEVDVLRVVNLLERCPVHDTRLWYGGHWLRLLIRAKVVLPPAILRVLLRCMPWYPYQQDQISYVIAGLVGQDSPHIFRNVQMLVEAGAELPEICWATIMTTGNHQLFARMALNVPGFVPEVYELWQCLLSMTLSFFHPIQPRWGDYLCLMEVLVSVSKRFSPQGFAGDQLLCLAILTSEGITARPNVLSKPSPTPPEYVRPLVDAMVRAGAEQDAMWVDRDARDTVVDTDRMAYYRNWTARELLAEIKRTGRL
ncbi:hypothetical protein FN846DRAFT_909971 [Sphaerosporella brunnea]|uniref:Ankyrin repeat-containing domain protein n=1 Tax=Sphaerosporella brunnea TaxID=1250544 RepID=A0A5J5EP96_9PEZI|nr:hypothetical protein FN846DRAFT_909971 [Sphaerosporella brunnea]